MRQVLSWRFVAALAALVGLAFFVNVAFARDETIARVIGPAEPVTRRPSLISLVLETEGEDFRMTRDGRARSDLVLTLPGATAPLRVFAGTPGEVTCQDLTAFGQCAVLAELLGDSVSWFALVPMGQSFRFELPAITKLEGGLAHLVNGWAIPYAPIIDRSRCDPQVESFSEFLRTVGRRHRSVYDLGAAEITAVVC